MIRVRLNNTPTVFVLSHYRGSRQGYHFLSTHSCIPFPLSLNSSRLFPCLSDVTDQTKLGSSLCFTPTIVSAKTIVCC